MWIMILKMAAATALYVLATVLLWKTWHKNSTHTLLHKLTIGLFYGLCSIVSSHIGIDYGNMLLNVRDLGPLAAGLFFDPVAGVVSGVIGGVERFIIGEFFDIGSFSRIACSISTVLAGLLSAGLNKWVYQGKRPSHINCLFLGAEMEVFHMYAVFITNRDDMDMASEVVGTCAMPMIVFTGIGLAVCTQIIARLSGVSGKKAREKRNIPIELRFQRWLLGLVAFLVVTSSALTYSLQTRVAYDDASEDLIFQRYQYQLNFGEDGDPARLKKELDDNNIRSKSVYLLVDAEQMLQYTCIGSPEGSAPADPAQVALIVEHAEGDLFEAVIPQALKEKCLCVSAKLDESHYLLIGTQESVIYANRQSQMMEILFLEILIFTALYLAIGMLVSRLIVRNLDGVNDSLAKITDGQLTEVVEVEESAEFTKLSDGINRTVTALRDMIDAAEKKMEEELQLAATIQDSALPQNFSLPTKRLELFASMHPAKQVGGDFYDFFYTGMDQLALVIADVSGKGIPAAMFMMRSKTAIKNYARNGLGPAEILENVNSTLCEGNDAHMFVTVWLGILDLKTGLMRCANAGHENPVLLRAGGDYAMMEDPHGFVLGGFENVPMTEYEIQLTPGDRLFVYTDGIPEAMNTEGKQYGEERLAACLNQLKNGTQEQILDGMLRSIRSFAGEAEQFDDITMLGITYLDCMSDA